MTEQRTVKQVIADAEQIGIESRAQHRRSMKRKGAAIAIAAVAAIGVGNKLIERGPSYPELQPGDPNTQTHVVQQGERIERLARQYEPGQPEQFEDELMRQSRLDGQYNIQAGERLIVPSDEPQE